MDKIKFLKTRPDAIIPHIAHDGDACFDFHIVLDEQDGVQPKSVKIYPHDTAIFGTGLKCSFNKGQVLKIYARSSTGIKRHLMLSNGTGIIDSGYRGEIHIALTNFSDDIVIVNHLDKVAQGELKDVKPVEIIEVTELDETERGENGIGSSGV